MAQKLRKHGKKLEKTSVGCHIDFTILLSMLKVKRIKDFHDAAHLNLKRKFSLMSVISLSVYALFLSAN